MPRKRAAHRKSYRIGDVMLGAITVICAAAVLWGYAVAYQVCYSAAEHYFEEVRHG